MNATFNSKETYLAATAEWKANYARLTVEARKVRAEFNAAASVFSKAGSYQWRAGAEANKGYNEAYKALTDARRNRDSVRNEANAALQNRAEMKAEASRQWQAAHATA